MYAYFDLDLFRDDLRVVISQMKVTYEQVGKEVGIHANTMNHFMNASRSPGIHIVVALLHWSGLHYEEYVVVKQKLIHPVRRMY